MPAPFSLVLTVYALFVRMPLPARRDAPVIALLGVVGITTYSLALNCGETHVAAVAASLIVGTVPIWTGLALIAFSPSAGSSPWRE